MHKLFVEIALRLVVPLLGLSQVVAGGLAASSKRKLPSMEEELQPAVQW